MCCTKGILNETLETPHQILKRVLPQRLHPRQALPAVQRTLFPLFPLAGWHAWQAYATQCHSMLAVLLLR